MSRYRFVNGQIVTPAAILTEATVTVDGGRITGIAERESSGEVIDLGGGWIVPGFIDTQCNGGGGVLFNDNPTVEGIVAIAQAHRPFGTTAFLPTLISDTPDVIATAMDAVDQAIDAGVPGIAGIHIEGPVINPERKGIHDGGRVRPLDEQLLALLATPRRGRVLVTLAPELVAVEDIRKLTAAGVIVSIGHTDADHDTAKAAFAAGVKGVTHLFNGMGPFGHRKPGATGAALDNQDIWCGLIVDGHHIHDATLRIALRARPLDRFMLVTDAMPCVGADTKDFMLQGRSITVRDGMCVGMDGTFAGSDLDMAGAVREVVSRAGLTVAQAAAMAATGPAAFLGLSSERGALAPGLRADWVWMTPDLHAAGTWIGGERAA
jgi:N-acetylglucosamine-6-phosphate deacetylase